MTETSNTKHSARVDDVLAGAIDAEEELDLRIEEPTTPLPGPFSEDERLRRSELAIALRPGAFPADRGVLLQVARSEQAPEEILELLEQLPIDTRFDTVQDVWEAVGGHRELRELVDIEEPVPAPTERAAAPPFAPPDAPNRNVLTLALGVVAGGVDVAFSALRAVVRLAARGVHARH